MQLTFVAAFALFASIAAAYNPRALAARAPQTPSTSDAATVNANGEMVAFDTAAVDTTFRSAGKRSAKLRA